MKAKRNSRRGRKIRFVLANWVGKGIQRSVGNTVGQYSRQFSSRVRGYWKPRQHSSKMVLNGTRQPTVKLLNFFAIIYTMNS